MNNELTHFGILGMKWGVRRYQNKDGSLTSTGKKRSREDHPDYATVRTKKKVREMSNAELRERNTRLQMENQYSQLKRDNSVVMRGATYAAVAAGALGTMLTLYNNSEKIISVGRKFVGR